MNRLKHEQEDRRQPAAIISQLGDQQPDNVYSFEGARPRPLLVPPFDEPIYTVNEAAKILRLSPNQARAIFRNEPGVHDLTHESGKSRFRQKRRSQLRIPHAVLARFWKRTEIYQREAHRQIGNNL